MNLDSYYSENNSRILISKDQASDFAKNIADDFNPLHDIDNARFCVPGDLLFSLVLAKVGLHEKMSFYFSGMVGDNLPLIFPENNDQNFSITDDDKKEYLKVETAGEISTDQDLISKFSESYVQFSGKSFPDLIVPLMKEHDVMISPKRPMVIYESMSIDLDTVEFENPSLELSETSLSVQGRKGFVEVGFRVKSNGEIVGKGVKRLALRGLSQFDQETIDQIVASYQTWKTNYKSK